MLGCALLSLALMVVDHRLSYLESVRGVLSAVVYPIQYVVNIPALITDWASVSMRERDSLLSENERLRQENLILQLRSQKNVSLRTENQRLRELLDSSVRLSERVLVADLLAVNTEKSNQKLVLDKGTRQGVYQGQPVVDSGGVMGQIIHLGPFTSTVMLLTDPGHSLPVQVNRNGLRALAVGTGSDQVIELEHIPNNADIKPGDLIVSSGIGGRFPAGYPVAEVTGVTRDQGASFAHITAKPNALLQQARQVLLVWPDTAPDLEGPTVSILTIP